MIAIKKLHPRRFDWYYNKDTRVLLIGLYYFTVGLDFGLKRSNWYRHFFRRCLVCDKPLTVLHRNQRVYFHKECRTEGRELARAKAELKQYEKVV